MKIDDRDHERYGEGYWPKIVSIIKQGQAYNHSFNLSKNTIYLPNDAQQLIKSFLIDNTRYINNLEVYPQRLTIKNVRVKHESFENPRFFFYYIVR